MFRFRLPAPSDPDGMWDCWRVRSSGGDVLSVKIASASRNIQDGVEDGGWIARSPPKSVVSGLPPFSNKFASHALDHPVTSPPVLSGERIADPMQFGDSILSSAARKSILDANRSQTAGDVAFRISRISASGT